MKLTAKTLNAVKSACENLGYSVRSYSGRGMYGDKCLGIDVPRSRSIATVAFSLVMELVEADEKEALEDLASVEWSQDSMGMGAIMYAPSLRWTDESEEADEEAEDSDAAE